MWLKLLQTATLTFFFVLIANHRCKIPKLKCISAECRLMSANTWAERPDTFGLYFFSSRYKRQWNSTDILFTDFKRLYLSSGRSSSQTNGLHGQMGRWYLRVSNRVASCPGICFQRVSCCRKFLGATCTMLSPSSWTSSKTSMRFCPVTTVRVENTQ